jgi:hypothetical protein
LNYTRAENISAINAAVVKHLAINSQKHEQIALCEADDIHNPDHFFTHFLGIITQRLVLTGELK